MIYLDNAATTQIHPEVLDAMLPYLTEEYGNAGAMYGLGRRAANAVAEAGRPVPYEIVARRPGDVAACYADPSHALEVLGWKAERGLKEMCEDAWRWQSQNPDGYGA